jgi:hypothetical protein
MASQITIACCCCKKQVQIGDNLLEIPPDLTDWVSIERKPFCGDCLAHFTEEDWDWCSHPPLPIRSSEIANLILEDVEPL